jgi:pimeloyl-ACP methyl ester carboxylesterase
MFKYKFRRFSVLRSNSSEVKLHFSITNQENYIENKKSIIMLHGLFGNKNNLRGISYTKEITDRRNSIIVDLRNHGVSDHHSSMTYMEMAEDLKRLVQQDIKLKNKFTLAGHSMGGKVAMTFACLYPNLLDGIIILDAIPKSHLENRHIHSNIEKVINVIHDYDLNKTSRKASLEYFNKELGGAIANLLNTNIITDENNKLRWRVNIKAIKSNFDKILGWENPGTYSGPVRILNGEKSTKFFIEDIINTFPISKPDDIVVVKGASHWIHADKPNETALEIAKFIKDIDEGVI